MKAYVEYLNFLIKLIEKVGDRQDEKFEQASDIIVETLLDGKMVHFWGPGGHSSIFAEDVMYREGELACINPIIDPNISLGHGALKEINYFERVEKLGKIIVKYNRIKEGDAVVIGSAYGVNPVCIEGALECKKVGAKVIAITSPAFSDSLDNDETRHATGKGLNEIADIYLNSYSPFDDLIMKIDEMDQKFGPVGTIMQLITLKALTTTVIKKLAQKGVEVPIWRNALEKGGTEFNDKYLNQLWCKVKSM
ncbi:MAG: sugar isomerase domain-containing protein [Clostridiaceae bacterium]|nr:sugar isomerase domain-containing protein [Clostridiaceae bacterium]